jgi:hypothetical protein
MLIMIMLLYYFLYDIDCLVDVLLAYACYIL